MRGRDGESDTLFLFFFLLHPEVRSELAGKMEGSTGRQRLSKTVISDCLAPTPPTPRAEEDCARPIDGAASDRSAGADHSDHHRAEKGPHAQALHRRPPQRTPKTNRNRPRARELGGHKIGEELSCTSGFSFRSKDYVKEDGGIPITKIGDIQDGGVYYTEKSSYVPAEFWEDQRLEQFKLQMGDVLIALTGATTGKSGVFLHKQRAFLNQRAGRFLPDDINLKRCFLPFLVLQPYFQNEIRSNILVAAQGNISPKRIERIMIGLPEPSEQEEFASTLHCFDHKVADSQAKRSSLQDLFRTLLHELMTAKIRVQDLDIQ